MQNLNLCFQNLRNISHLPTWFFIIGYPVFWIELYFINHNNGLTSPAAWGIFAMVAVLSSYFWLKQPKPWVKQLRKQFLDLSVSQKFFWICAAVLSSILVLIITCAASKPLHLLQEFDCLHYHYTLPRQHLIFGSFQHLPWAADDLFLLPIDFALAPFWFVSAYLNKWPQLLIFFGLTAVTARLAFALDSQKRPWVMGFVILACLASHGLGIQMGTGMLDLTIAYLFYAALDSLRTRQWGMAAVEAAFVVWSKPFMPMMFLVIFAVLFFLFINKSWLRLKITDELGLGYSSVLLRFFIIFSLFVAGPFIAKSIYYAGTPLYPFTPGLLPWAKIKAVPHAWESLQNASHLWMSSTKNGYGQGRDLWAFISHWWYLAVPEKGVNNSFDYPLGLPYLLCIGPFLFFLVKDIGRRCVSSYALFVAIYWGLWWFGSQQSRFLFIPILLVFCLVMSRLKHISYVLGLCLLIALTANGVSLWKAHQQDMFLGAKDIVRAKDRELMDLNAKYLQEKAVPIDVPDHDVAYAQFPVRVTKEKLPHTIAF